MSDLPDGTPGGGGQPHHEDVLDSRTADALRRGLAREASSVHPTGDGLTRIRARTTGQRARSPWLLPVAAAAAGVAVAGGVGWATIDRQDAPVASPGPSPVGSGSATPSSSPTVTAEGTQVAIPVYYVGAQPGPDGADSTPEFRLFREFHPTTSAETPSRQARVQIALEEMLANAPLDPNYGDSSWPAATTIRSVTVDATTALITVDLGGLNPAESGEVPAPSEGQAAASVQQLVFTATAAASYDGFQASGVAVVLDGKPADALFGVDISEPLQRDTGDYRAAIWILSLDEGGTVTSPIEVSGEARLSASDSGRWYVTDSSGIVADGAFGTGRCCEFETFDFAIESTLPPGSYTLELYDMGPTGDLEAPPFDTKSFSVEGPN